MEKLLNRLKTIFVQATFLKNDLRFFPTLLLLPPSYILSFHSFVSIQRRRIHSFLCLYSFHLITILPYNFLIITISHFGAGQLCRTSFSLNSFQSITWCVKQTFDKINQVPHNTIDEPKTEADSSGMFCILIIIIVLLSDALKTKDTKYKQKNDSESLFQKLSANTNSMDTVAIKLFRCAHFFSPADVFPTKLSLLIHLLNHFTK